jgi:hypothetical protein
MHKAFKFVQNVKFLKHFHAIMSLLWLVMIPIAVFTTLQSSVPFLVFISLWALVGAHWSAWQAARAEQKE